MPEFRELLDRRRRFLLPATIFWLAFFLTYLFLAAFAPGFMGEQIVEGLTVGFVLSVAQVLMTWTVTVLSIRRSDREFEPLEQRAAEVAQEPAGADGGSNDRARRRPRGPAAVGLRARSRGSRTAAEGYFEIARRWCRL
jgi:uncharacterized membrane protein (DUF485 family)